MTNSSHDIAIQFPRVNIKAQDEELLYGRVEMATQQNNQGGMERPWASSGMFAIVYKFRGKSGDICALRCFKTLLDEDIKLRYEKMGLYFEKHIPELTAHFTYYEQGLKVDKIIYPLIRMDWIEGLTLHEKLSQLCSQKDHAGLDDLRKQWLYMFVQLRQARIAHGDLSGENVMVRSDNRRLVLIDYDGVYIPEFNGMPGVIAGQEDYQHPDMSQRPFNDRIDDFSALVIYTALLALQEKPALWQDSVRRSAGILFNFKDFRAESQFKLMHELEGLNNPMLTLALQALRQACLQTVDQVNFPPELCLMQLEVSLATDDDEKIKQSWQNLKFLLEQYKGTQKHLSRIDLAEKRLQALEHLRDALSKKNIQAILQKDIPLLKNYTKLTLDECKLLGLLHAFVKAQADDDEKRLVELHVQIQQIQPSAVVFTVQEQQAIINAQQRIATLEQIRTALKSQELQQIAAVFSQANQQDIARHLQKSEHQQVELAHRFMEAYQQHDEDATIAAYTAIERLPQPSCFRFTLSQEQDIQLFLTRKAILSQLRTAIRTGNLRRIAATYKPLLDNYVMAQDERELLQVARTFALAYTTNEDDKIVAAFERVQQSLFYNTIMFSAEEKMRIEEAQQRKAALARFQAAIQDGRAHQIVAAYNSCIDVSLSDEERAQYKLANAYVQGYNDAEALVIAYDAIQHSPYRSHFVFLPEEQKRIDQSRQCEQALAAFQEAAKQKKARYIVTTYDALPLNTNKYTTERQQQLVASARDYVAMHKALQEAISAQQDKTLRQIYKEALAKQFSDITESEQQYIDQVLITQRLESVLRSHKFAEALTIARSVADPTGKKISPELKRLLSDATRNYIKQQDIVHVLAWLEKRRDSNYAIVRWQWPKDQLIQDAVIIWSPKSWPKPPQEVQGFERNWIRAIRYSHQRERIIDFPVGRISRVYLQIYAVLRDEWDTSRRWYFSSGATSTSRQEAILVR